MRQEQRCQFSDYCSCVGEARPHLLPLLQVLLGSLPSLLGSLALNLLLLGLLLLLLQPLLLFRGLLLCLSLLLSRGQRLGSTAGGSTLLLCVTSSLLLGLDALD